MNSVIVLRKTDAGRMADLHKASFETQARWDQVAFEDFLTLPSTLALGAENEKSLGGLLLIQKALPDAEILTLAVAPTARRKGLATTLLSAALQMLGQGGIRRLMLDVAADNQGAIAFYHQHGFREDGRRKDYYRTKTARREDAVLMSRPVAGQI